MKWKNLMKRLQLYVMEMGFEYKGSIKIKTWLILEMGLENGYEIMKQNILTGKCK